MAPTFEMTDALKEAYASVKTDVITYYTCEFWRTGWTEPARIVYGWDLIEARLEDGEDYDESLPPEFMGQSVSFYPLPFEFVMPSTLADEVPSFEFKFYDPERVVIEKVFEGQNDPQPIQMYLRVYLSNRMMIGPETVPVPRFHVGSVKINSATAQVTGKCVFQDYMGRSAPFRTYTLAEFPGLRRR